MNDQVGLIGHGFVLRVGKQDWLARKMRRIFTLIMMIAVLGVAACTDSLSSSAPPVLGADGKPLPRLYRIGPGMEGRIQFRILDSVNSLRAASNAPAVSLNAQLNAAAATHSRDMSIQNRPWHFGSDGSSPIERVRRVGYNGRLIGEAISETYETEVQTLAAWMEEENTRRIILDPTAQDMGFSYFQETNGKIWWTLVLGGSGEVLTPAERPAAEVQSANRIVAEIVENSQPSASR